MKQEGNRIGRINLLNLDKYGRQHLVVHLKNAKVEPRIIRDVEEEIEIINTSTPSRVNGEN